MLTFYPANGYVWLSGPISLFVDYPELTIARFKENKYGSYIDSDQGDATRCLRCCYFAAVQKYGMGCSFAA